MYFWGNRTLISRLVCLTGVGDIYVCGESASYFRGQLNAGGAGILYTGGADDFNAVGTEAWAVDTGGPDACFSGGGRYHLGR